MRETNNFFNFGPIEFLAGVEEYPYLQSWSNVRSYFLHEILKLHVYSTDQKIEDKFYHSFGWFQFQLCSQIMYYGCNCDVEQICMFGSLAMQISVIWPFLWVISHGIVPFMEHILSKMHLWKWRLFQKPVVQLNLISTFIFRS